MVRRVGLITNAGYETSRVVLQSLDGGLTRCQTARRDNVTVTERLGKATPGSQSREPAQVTFKNLLTDAIAVNAGDLNGALHNSRYLGPKCQEA